MSDDTTLHPTVQNEVNDVNEVNAPGYTIRWSEDARSRIEQTLAEIDASHSKDVPHSSCLAHKYTTCLRSVTDALMRSCPDAEALALAAFVLEDAAKRLHPISPVGPEMLRLAAQMDEAIMLPALPSVKQQQ